ncbi:MAG TPA: cyclase family protein [Stellaceae bacterium]|nr:cyclase family protein [Stellaceae bacterium]
MTEEAWGRWGAADERGALNWIGEGEVMRACSLPKRGQVLSLAQPLGRQTPMPHHRPRIAHFMDRDGGDYAAGARRAHGFQFADDSILLALHSGTHMDGLCHAWYEDRLYNGFPSDSIRSTTGARHCGIDKLSPIVTRGVLLDVASVAGGPLANGAEIDRTLLEKAAERADVELGTGDAVLIRTGWLENQDGATVDFGREPGITVDAALFLAEARVALVGADNFAIEAMPFAAGTTFPVHQRLIRDYGVPLLEGMVLKPLAEVGVGAFLFMAAPLPIAGGTGSPLTPVAVL